MAASFSLMLQHTVEQKMKTMEAYITCLITSVLPDGRPARAAITS
jgi:hypothetical protein